MRLESHCKTPLKSWHSMSSLPCLIAKNHTAWTIWGSLFSLSIIPWRFVRFLQVPKAYSLSLLCSSPWCGCTTVRLTIHLLEDIWAISSIWLSQIKRMWTYAYRFRVKISFHFSGVNAQACTCLMHSSYMFSSVRSCQTVFQSVDSIFPPASSERSSLGHPHQRSVLFLRFGWAILVGEQWYLTGALICIRGALLKGLKVWETWSLRIRWVEWTLLGAPDGCRLIRTILTPRTLFQALWFPVEDKKGRQGKWGPFWKV